MEQWKDIPETDGYYQISNHGRIRSWKNGRWGKRQSPKIMKLGYCRNGYKRYKVLIDDKLQNFSVHRMVAEAFIPNPENKPQVNHIDTDKANNHVSNLEWCTQSENMIHRGDMGVANYKRGEDLSSSIFTEKQVKHIRNTYKENDITQREMAEYYDCSQSTIAAIITRRSWGHI